MQIIGGMWAMAGGRVGGRMAGVKCTVRVGVPHRGPRWLTSSPSRVASFAHAPSSVASPSLCTLPAPISYKPCGRGSAQPCQGRAHRGISRVCRAPWTRNYSTLHTASRIPDLIRAIASVNTQARKLIASFRRKSSYSHNIPRFLYNSRYHNFSLAMFGNA